MKILAFDTSAKVGSVAIMDDEEVVAVREYSSPSGHAEILISEITAVLKRGKCRLCDVEGIAVSVGPGSFTGLRIGLATAKGIAISIGVPIVGISSLQALAFMCRSHNTIVPCINAYRGEVYAAVYSLRPLLPECSVSPETLCEKLNEIEGEPVFVGDGAVHYEGLFRERLGEKFKLVKKESFPIATEVGLLALPKFESGSVSDIVTLAPNYIRRSDAEIKKGL